MFLGIQKGAIAALAVKEIWFEQLNDIYAQRRKLVFKLAALLNTEFDLHCCGLFVWAKLKDTSKSSVDVIEKILQKYNVFITPGSIFGSQGEGYIRFSLCVKAEQIIEAIERITKK
jgi:aspartate/methionine/tyrosine aminotransferase